MRSKENGTWFVQAICEVFFARAHKDHLGDLMTKVRYLIFSVLTSAVGLHTRNNLHNG